MNLCQTIAISIFSIIYVVLENRLQLNLEVKKYRNNSDGNYPFGLCQFNKNDSLSIRIQWIYIKLEKINIALKQRSEQIYSIGFHLTGFPFFRPFFLGRQTKYYNIVRKIKTFNSWYTTHIWWVACVEMRWKYFTLNSLKRCNNEREIKKTKDKCIYNRIACIVLALSFALYLNVFHFKLSVLFSSCLAQTIST